MTFFKIILYAFLAYIVYWLYRFFKALNKGTQSRRVSKRQSGIMVKDEMCNTYLPKEDALKANYAGKDFYFCSNQCRQKFLEQKKPH
jgi:YHS domain-containing protein